MSPHTDGPVKSTTLVFYLNGKRIEEARPDPEVTLLTYLREALKLCGTKLGCGEGGCGACTVMISRVDRGTDSVHHLAVNACLLPVCAVHGMAVTTVEGIGNTRSRLHPVQERIAKAHGTQCGFCTPGFVMSMYALLRSSSTPPSMHQLELAFQGNLCRCTGYRPIIEGYRTFTADFQCGMGDKCCRNVSSKGTDQSDDSNASLYDLKQFLPYDPTQDPIFPPKLKLTDELDRQMLLFINGKTQWHRPISLSAVLQLKQCHPEAKLVNGNTEIGVEVKFKHAHYPVLICTNQIQELNTIEIEGNGINVGASVSLDRLQTALENEIKTRSDSQCQIFKAIVKMLHYFGGKQIRNVASVGGNIMTGSPISDLNPIFMAAGVELTVESSQRGRRNLKMDQTFYTGYRTNVIRSDEVLISIKIPYTDLDQHVVAWKQSKRRDDDIAIVNMAVNVHFHRKNEDGRIKRMVIAYGGIAATTVIACKTGRLAEGMPWDLKTFESLKQSLIEELPLSADAPGGMVAYRLTLIQSLLFKSYLRIEKRLKFPSDELHSNDKTASTPKSAQFFKIGLENEKMPVGQPEMHASALKHATGDAIYCDDMPRFENEVYMAFVFSKRAHARILSVDATEALRLSGVVAYMDSKNLTTECNTTGYVIEDEEIFRGDTVTAMHQVIGIVLGESQSIAQKAARLVRVEYDDILPLIVTIEDAIRYQSYSGSVKEILFGDPDTAFAVSDHKLSSEFRIGAQEHFYMETHSTLVVPEDGDLIRVYCNSQHPAHVQSAVAKALAISQNRVIVTVKRIGGAFGGKEARGQAIVLPAAIASAKLQRPVRCMLDREEDIQLTGQRHPFLFKYDLAFTRDGHITGIDVCMYSNMGYSLDLSESVLDQAMNRLGNALKIPNARIRGYLCKTNCPSNTAFRGFGGPQAMVVSELMLRDICRVTKLNYVEVAEKNLMGPGDLTYFNQVVDDDNMKRCFRELLSRTDYDTRSEAVQSFNRGNSWRKRGLAIVNTAFGIGFSEMCMNQGAALVNIYLDGSVMVEHGGTEMGQGLHIKMIQVAATVLEIPVEQICISETSTKTVPNATTTAASMGSDLFGGAVLDACMQLKKRLQPYKEQFPALSFREWVQKAYLDRVSLSVAGHYKVPPPLGEADRSYDYFVYGSAFSEVEVDCLTGDHRVLRTDIVMDLGESLNPAIDVGQIEGAFMQGYGLYTMEEVIYSPRGEILSKGPGTYKIPSCSDIPGEFNVSLLTGSKNPRAVFSSKAVGEPPLFSAASVYFAIKEAVSAYRVANEAAPDFTLICPATAARIRMACTDEFVREVDVSDDNLVPWNVLA